MVVWDKSRTSKINGFQGENQTSSIGTALRDFAYDTIWPPTQTDPTMTASSKRIVTASFGVDFSGRSADQSTSPKSGVLL